VLWIAGAAMALIGVAPNEWRPVLKAGTGVLAAICVKLSNAAVVLVPTMFSFDADVTLQQL
jgi:hypothetical protein